MDALYLNCPKIRERHYNTLEEFKSEQAKAGDVENALKANIQRLQQQTKEQSRTKITYSVRGRHEPGFFMFVSTHSKTINFIVQGVHC